VSSTELLQGVARKLESRRRHGAEICSLEGVLKIWRAAAKTVGDELKAGRGCRLEGLGTFTLDGMGRPSFLFSSDFVARHRLKDTGPAPPPAISRTAVNSKLNFAKVAAEAGGGVVDRRIAESVVTLALAHLSYHLKRSKSVGLSFHPTAELACSPHRRQAVMRFLAGFCADALQDQQSQVPAGHSGRPTARALDARRQFEKQHGGRILPPPPQHHHQRQQQLHLHHDLPTPPYTATNSSLVSGAGRYYYHRPPSQQLSSYASSSAPSYRTPSVASSSRTRTVMVPPAVEKVRRKCIERAGCEGISTLACVLQTMDDNGDGFLDKAELKGGLKDFGMVLNKSELQEIFGYFDRNGDGLISHQEFLRGVRGPMSGHRQKLVRSAFRRLGRRSADGIVTGRVIRDVYDCSWQPEVKSGSKREEQGLQELISALRADGEGVICEEAFLEYYEGISPSIQHDEDFENMMRVAWRSAASLESEPPDRRQPAGRTTTSSSTSPPGATAEQLQHLHPSWNKLQAALFSPPCTLEALVRKLGASNVRENPEIARAALAQRLHQSLGGSRKAADELATTCDPGGSWVVDVQWLHEELCKRFGKPKLACGRNGGSGIIVSSVERVRSKILERCGGSGMRGISRALAIMDDDGSKCLTKDELKNGLQDYGIALSLKELDDVMTYFDRDRNGTVSIDEFLRGLRGPMSDRRTVLVRQAFAILDRTGDGIITIDDLRGTYDCSWHPEVKNGTKTEDQALGQFLTAFDVQEKDGVITQEEFMDYYAGVSASIDGDDVFELMMVNAWRMPAGGARKEGSWCKEDTSSRRRRRRRPAPSSRTAAAGA
jgi:Ca2+-binding EF-hand superfamily protein